MTTRKNRERISKSGGGMAPPDFSSYKNSGICKREQFLFEQAYDRTQILFLDIEMEKMDGIALARETENTTARCRSSL